MFAFLPLLLAWSPGSVEYVLQPVPVRDRTDLDVTLSVAASDPLTLTLPKDAFGLGSLAACVHDLRAEQGTVLGPGSAPDQRRAVPGPDGRIHVRYRMSYPPDGPQTASYGPVAPPGTVQAFGCQWMIDLGEEQPREYKFSWKNMPKNWHSYSSLPTTDDVVKTQATKASLRNLVMGAAKGEAKRFDVRGKPVEVHVGPGLKLDGGKVGRLVEKIVRLQRERFDDYRQPYFVISIQARPDNVAGIRVPGCFACFVRPDVREQELLLLLSHEMLHNWVPGAVTVDAPDGDRWWRWSWFSEGFDDYLSRVVLFEGGLLSRDTFVGLVNRDIRNFADDPFRDHSDQQIAADQDAGLGGTPMVKLAYYRGALVASQWDARIRAKSGGKRSLMDVVRELAAGAQGTQGVVKVEDFVAKFAAEGIDVMGGRQSWLIEAKPVELAPDAMGAEYRLKSVPVPAFEPGYDVVKTASTRQVTGLVPGSPADKAGLRDGDVLVDVANGNRFGNAFRFDEPIVVRVKREGLPRTLTYSPFAGTRQLPQYVKVSTGKG